MENVKIDIWMPIYIGDYLAETSRLSTEEHGAYLLITLDYWRNGPPPDSDRKLASITRTSASKWKKIKPSLGIYFQIEDGYWINKKIEKELLAARDRREKASDRAVKAATARWKRPTDAAISNASSIDQAHLDQCPSSLSTPSPSPLSTPSPSPSPSPTATTTTPATYQNMFSLNSPEVSVAFREFIQAFPGHRRGGLRDAHQAWQLIIPNPDENPEMFSSIMAGLDVWKNSGDWNCNHSQYVPNPAKFLTDERWSTIPAHLSLDTVKMSVNERLSNSMKKGYGSVVSGNL